MKSTKNYSLLLTGIGATTMGAFTLSIGVGGLLHSEASTFGAIFGIICAILFIALGLMMIYEHIRRRRRIAYLEKNGTRHTGRIFGYRKETTNDVSLVVRFFDESGYPAETIVTTEQSKKEDYPVGTDVVFVKNGDDAAVLERVGVQFTDEEHERLVNIRREAAKRKTAEIKAKRAASPHSLFDITDIIAPDDETVRRRMEELTGNPLKYYAEHYDPEDYLLDESEDADHIKWICMAWLLIEQGYACEADDDAEPEREDFAQMISNLNGAKKHALTVSTDALEEYPFIPDWWKGVDEQWKEKGFCLGYIDIESESYILFPCSIEELERLIQIASDLCYTILRAADMQQ